MASYSEGFHSSQHIPGLMTDVWGDFENFERADPPAPCRTIEITDAIRAMDAQRQAPLPCTWPAKEFISLDNLKSERRAPAKNGRVLEPKRFVLRLPKLRLCACGVQLREGRKKFCGDCAARARTIREKTRLEKLRPRKPKTVCAGGCGRNARIDLCWRCRKRLKERAACVRPRCVNECGRTIRIGKGQRPDKLCKVCARKGAKAYTREHIKQNAQVTCEVCEKLIDPRSTRCKTCAPLLKSFPDVICSQCPKVISRHGKHGVCRKCYYRKPKLQAGRVK